MDMLPKVVVLAALFAVVGAIDGSCPASEGSQACIADKTADKTDLLQTKARVAAPVTTHAGEASAGAPGALFSSLRRRRTAASASAGFIYGVGPDGRIYKQALSTGQAPPTGPWVPASGPTVTSIAIGGDKIYGVGPDRRIWQQDLSAMTTTSPWSPASGPTVTSIAIGGDKIYGVGPDTRIWQQDLSAMTTSSPWSPASVGSVTSIAIGGDKIYGVDPVRRIWQQDLSAMTTSSGWSGPINNGPVIAIAIKGDTMYVVGPDRMIRRQVLSGVGSSHVMAWPPASYGLPVSSIAFSN